MIPLPTNGDQEHSAVILRLRGDSWNGLRAVQSKGVVRIEETRSFAVVQASTAPEEHQNDAEGTEETLIDWLEAIGNPPAYVLLPAGLTISRVLDLTPEEGEDLEQSLRLQAESHLLGGSSAHRIGMAPLPNRSETINQGIVITWPESSQFERPLLAEEPFCISETAALLGMLPAEPLETPLLHGERATGSLALILEHEGRLLVRSTREQDDQSDHWRKAVVHAVIETAITNHQPTEVVESLRHEVQEAIKGRDELLMLPDTVREHLEKHVQGAGDAAWWQEWGLSVGAFLATRSQLQMLTTLRQRKPVETGGAFGEVSRALSRPQTAAAILVAAFFAIALLPILAAWLRLAIVENKIDDQAQLTSILKTSEQQKAIYKEIAQRAWPMTKLLGDVANCIPLGIDADQIAISEGDAIILRGSAGSYDNQSPRQLLQEMGSRFDRTLLFSGWKFKDDPIDSGGKIEFSINLSLAKPFSNVRDFAEDFGEKSHAEQRYAAAFARIAKFNEENNLSDEGTSEGEATTAIASAEPDQEPVSTLPTTPRTSTSSASATPASNDAEQRTVPPGVGRESLLGVRGGSAPSRRSSSNASSRGTTISGTAAGPLRRSNNSGAVSSGGPAPIPDEFSDTELAALSNSEAKELLGRVAKAKNRKDLDEPTANRLRNDVYRILEHMKSTPDSGGSS